MSVFKPSDHAPIHHPGAGVARLPLSRIRTGAPIATEQDALASLEDDGPACELVDGVLVEKAMGATESYLAMLIGRLIGNFADEHNLGFVLGADGATRLAPGLIRVPDVSFFRWDRTPDGQVPTEPAVDFAPDLAVEVLSKSNTPDEMKLKLEQYLAAGVRLIWYVDSHSRTVTVYSAGSATPTVLTENDTLDGGDVLPALRIDVQRIFRTPRKP